MTVAALTILGPLAAAAAIPLLRRGAAALALAGTALGLAAAAVTLFRAANGAGFSATLPGLPGLPLRLVVEPLTAVLATLVAAVGALVLLYAVGYMRGEGGRPRFFAEMSFFVAAMQALVLAGDWVLLLAAWELIGLSSYLLIGFYLQRPAAASGATRAFLYTRSADLGLYVAIFVLVTMTGTSEIARTLDAGGAAAAIAGIGLLVAAAGKSAQAPFYGWLQDAMAGPTPVSALLHSATLVAAGAILMIRTFPLLPPGVLLVVGALGGLTAVVAGLVAVAEGDLKRLLAASTSSQYGFMLLAVGAGAPVAATAHLLTHAAIKSSLFLGSGVFQHARGSTGFGDLGGVGRERRYVFIAFVAAGLSLAAIPPLAGFFSKEAIVSASFGSPYAPLFAPLALAGTVLTGVYVARAVRLLWRGEGRGGPVEGLAWMAMGLAALAAFAAALGPVLAPLGDLLGAELPGFGIGAILGPVPALSLAAALFGLALGWFLPAGRLLGPLRPAAGRGFRLGGGFEGLLARPAVAAASAADRLDGGIHAVVLGVGRAALYVARASRLTDEAGVDRLIAAFVRGTRRLGGRARGLQSGLVHRELVLAVAGVALIFVLLVIGL